MFSGAGGLDIGFHTAGFHITKAVELEENYAAVMAANCGAEGFFGDDTQVICMDIADFDPSSVSNIDWVIGGPPCQTFSAAGRRANGVLALDDPRGVLFEEYVAIVKHLKPKGFLYENVYGLVGAEGGEPWRLIQESFKNAGYDLYHRVLDAADYGAPQHRERLIMVGVRTGMKPFLFPRPTHGPDSIDQKPFNSAKNAISDLEPSRAKNTEFGGRWGHLLAAIPPGLNYSFYTEKLGHPHPVFAWRSKFSDFLYKADPDRPVRTIKANGGKYTGPLHWENRHFTPEELQRLQSFPTTYKLVGTSQVKRAVIGNSVPPALSAAMAVAVSKQFFDMNNTIQLHWMDEAYKLGFRQRKRILTKYYQELARGAHEKHDFSFEPTLTDSYKFSIEKGINLIRDHKGIWEVSVKEKNLTLRILCETVENIVAPPPATIRLTGNGWSIPLDAIEIHAPSNSRDGLLVAFKAAEQIVRDRFGVDNLVQLYGYYKESECNFEVNVIVSDKNTEPWESFCNILRSDLIGDETHSLIMWAKALNCREGQVIPKLVELRSLGFDFRNRSTNLRLPEDHVMLSYPFPTLHSGSVQFGKSLIPS